VQILARRDFYERRITMIRTINELLSVIGKNIEDIQDPKVSQSDRQIKIERADNTAKLAKQFINACGLIQKGDVMSGRHDRTDAVIGEIK
jgi:hypothetical protein